MNIMQKQAKRVRQTVIWLVWLIAWQVAAMLVGNEVLFAGPRETLKALARLLAEADFGRILLTSSLKLSIGFVLGLLAGGIFGCLGAKKKWINDVLSPFLSFMKSVPVAAFVVMLLVWWGSKWLSVAIVFIVVFPHIYMAFLEGINQTDTQMLEVAKVFEIPAFNKVFYLYRKALQPFLTNGLKLSLGLSWKSGVAAEVIGTPDYSIGEALYMAKTHLNTAEVFAWIIVILALSTLFEKVGLWLFERFCSWNPKCKAPVRKSGNTGGNMTDEINTVPADGRTGKYRYTISKSYGDHVIWDNFTLELEKGKIYTLQAPSGRGKTTLLRVLAGLEENRALPAADMGGGKSNAEMRPVSMAFQEDRLLLEETPLTNIELCIGSDRREEIKIHLLELIPELNENQTCRELSGGMKRRVCLVRAMMAQSDMVLLDEPFAGLDETTRQKAIEYILKTQKGRMILVVTHHENDAKMLNSTHFDM